MNLSELKTKMLLLEKNSKYFTFITSLMLSLPMEISDKIPTACATSNKLLFNQDFLDSCSEKEAIGLLCHETLHVVFDHISRRENRDPKKHNLACDAVINDIILNELNLPLPAEPVTFDSLGISDTTLSSEEVYNLINKDCNTEMEIFDLDPNMDEGEGDSKDSSNGSDLNIKASLPKGSDLEQLITSSAIISDFDWSDAPNNELTRLIRNLTDPKVPWERELLGLLFDYENSEDETWDKFNQRFFTLPMLMPGEDEAESLTANCYIDISGSLTDDQVTTILSEIKGIKESLNNSKLDIITWNTSIVDEFNDVQEIESLKINGTGGTNIKCVFNHIKKHKPKLAICFTDGYFATVKYISKDTTLVWVINNGELDKSYKQKVIMME